MPGEVRAEFWGWYRHSRIIQIRYIAFLTATLYLLYTVFEQGATSDRPGLRLVIHGVLMPVLLVGIGWLSFYAHRHRLMIRLLMLAPLVAIAANLFLNMGQEHFAHFAPELYLALIWVFAISGLTLGQALVTAGAGTALVVMAIFGNAIDPGLLRLHGLWTLSSVSFGLMVAFLIEKANKALFLQQRQLTLTASLDGLTGLWNRPRIEQVLTEEIARARRYDTPFSVIMVDIDYFKSVNDNHGHAAGDGVLMQFAALLRNNVREVDQVGRLGGEEFLIVLPDTDQWQAREVAGSLCDEVRSFEFDGVGDKTASFGVTQYRPGEPMSDLLSRADQGLYRAKRGGRDRVELV